VQTTFWRMPVSEYEVLDVKKEARDGNRITKLYLCQIGERFYSPFIGYLEFNFLITT